MAKRKKKIDFPEGIHTTEAFKHYEETIEKVKGTGYYSDSYLNLIARYANELVMLPVYEEDVEENGRYQIHDKTGFQQKSVFVQNLEACKRNLLQMEKELMLTPYQGKKGDTDGKKKKPRAPNGGELGAHKKGKK